MLKLFVFFYQKLVDVVFEFTVIDEPFEVYLFNFFFENQCASHCFNNENFKNTIFHLLSIAHLIVYK